MSHRRWPPTVRWAGWTSPSLAQRESVERATLSASAAFAVLTNSFTTPGSWHKHFAHLCKNALVRHLAQLSHSEHLAHFDLSLLPSSVHTSHRSSG